MIDLSRRRFLFGLAAAPVIVPALKHFILTKFELSPDPVLELVQDLQQDPVFGGSCTNFAHLSEARRKCWEQEAWAQARDSMFFFGKGIGNA